MSNSVSTVIATATLTLAAVYAYQRLNRTDLSKRVLDLPYIRDKVNLELKQKLRAIEEETFEGRVFQYDNLPEEGISPLQILTLLGEKKAPCIHRCTTGKISGSLYTADEELLKLQLEAYRLCQLANPLHSDLFMWVNQCEAEVVSMCAGLMHGGFGTMTSGGTMSILHAVKAYRSLHPCSRPNIVVPKSAHASFDKAGALMNIEVRKANLSKDFTASLDSIQDLCDENTIMIAASVPSYPHGVADDVPQIAAFAHQYGIPLHVDCCLGGFTAPFSRHLPPFDLRIPGVTSISMDTHKYGNAEKGSSVILYKTRELRSHQFFLNTDWQGGIYMTPTLEGSKPAFPIVSAWISLLYHGSEGYTKLADSIDVARIAILERVKDIPQLTVMGNPKLSVIAFASPHIHQIADNMEKKGWSLNLLQNPPAFHFCITNAHTKNGDFVDTFIADLKDAVEQVDPAKKPSGTAAIYSAAEKIPPHLIDQIGSGYLDIVLQTKPK